jgi:hypothetical protein
MADILEKELKEIARITAGIERHSEENDPALDKQLEKIDGIFKDFNRKYPKLTLKIGKTVDQHFVRILINESVVKNVFDEVASKLKGLTGVGLASFDEATVQESEKFADLVSKIGKKACLTYTLDSGIETIQLELNEKENKVELIYEIKSLVNPVTPQFQLIKEYAEKQKDDSIKFLEKCYELGFTDIEDAVLFEWEDKFYPKMLE